MYTEFKVLFHGRSCEFRQKNIEQKHSLPAIFLLEYPCVCKATESIDASPQILTFPKTTATQNITFVKYSIVSEIIYRVKYS